MISSLGLIEVVGLVGAIEAGDTAVKAANVRLLGLELTRGSGLVTVKIEGDVAAVKAAVDSAVMAAERLTTVVSKLVIARPSSEVEKLVELAKNMEIQSCEEKEVEKSEGKSVTEVKDSEVGIEIKAEEISQELEEKTLSGEESSQPTKKSRKK